VRKVKVFHDKAGGAYSDYFFLQRLTFKSEAHAIQITNKYISAKETYKSLEPEIIYPVNELA
jgi:hypothetical protein